MTIQQIKLVFISGLKVYPRDSACLRGLNLSDLKSIALHILKGWQLRNLLMNFR